MIKLDPSICSNFAEATSREWLETNGIGGFASGTVSGARSRRYHALLTAATEPPLGRISMLSKFEETLFVDGDSYELSSNQYTGTIHPKGFSYLRSFSLDPFPVWVYEAGGVTLEKRVFMAHGENTTVIRYSAKAPAGMRASITLELRPLTSFVDYHHLRKESDPAVFAAEIMDGTVSISASDTPAQLFIHHNGEVSESGHWYRNFELAIERERGFDFHEDLFQPCVLTFDIAQEPADVIVSTETKTDRAHRLERREITRRRELIKVAGVKADVDKTLVLAADQFIVTRGDGHTVIAGYPWFSDWGRDTMIALNGLTLSTNRPAIARDILLEFSRHISEGMLPNRFPDAGNSAEYNTVDATLWYFDAVRAYAEFTQDFQFVDEHLYEKLAGIIACHMRGTRYNIHVDTDGLLCAGESGTQLTWMDAKIGELVITPRKGKPVEVQALWYNALCVMADLARRFGHVEDHSRFTAMAELAKLSFNSLFWNEGAGCLYDVVVNGSRDAAVRPNQIFAVSLTHSMLPAERAAGVVAKVEAALLTPYGLRTLAAGDPNYVRTYIGSPFERDSAYHQGTVWAWLIGGFVDALYKLGVDNVKGRVETILSGFERHLEHAGLGQISEIFDAEAPHAPRGCPAQAWSVAEVLRSRRRI